MKDYVLKDNIIEKTLLSSLYLHEMRSSCLCHVTAAVVRGGSPHTRDFIPNDPYKVGKVVGFFLFLFFTVVCGLKPLEEELHLGLRSVCSTADLFSLF